MIRPTPRAVLAFAASVPLALVIASIRPAWWSFAFDYGALAMAAIGLDLLLLLPGRLVKERVEVPERLHIGEDGAITVRLAPVAVPRPTPIELIADAAGDLDPARPVTVTLAAGEGAVARLPLVPRRRGRVTISRVSLRWQGPLGLVERIRRVPLNRTIAVLQNIRGVHDQAIQFFAREALYGVKVQRERGEGTEFDSLRDYTPGLDTRHIDWKHSARHRELVCKEFRTERSHPIVLAFDTGHLMSEPIDGVPRLDHAIGAGLLLGWIALRTGDLVGSFAFDAIVRQHVQPLRGLASFQRLQAATAALDYRSEETNFTLGLAELTVRLKRRALVVLFTDFVDTVTAELMIESLGRISQRHVVIFVSLRDPYLQETIDAPPERFETVAEAVIADDFTRERRAVLDRLERQGVHCLDVPRAGLSVGLINRYLMVKQRGMI